MTPSRSPAFAHIAATRAIRAGLIAAPLEDLRAYSAAGVVLAAFERSAYLDLDGRILALTASDLEPGPFTIGVDGFSSLGPIAPGELVSLGDGRLRIGQGAVDLGSARVWDPALPPLRQDLAPGLVRDARAAVLAGLGSDAPRSNAGALGGILPELSSGLEAIAAFLSGKSSARTVASAVASRVAGRGPGLTPSGDDLLVGIVHALTLWPSLASAAGGVSQARDTLVGAAIPRTTRISAAYLEAARQGWGSAPWHGLARGIGEGPGAARAAARRILGIGETSGADALTGFCWAWDRVEA